MKYVDFVAISVLLSVSKSRVRLKSIRETTDNGTLVYGPKASSFDASRRLVYAPTVCDKDGVIVIQSILRCNSDKGGTTLIGGMPGKNMSSLVHFGGKGKCCIHYGQDEFFKYHHSPGSPFQNLSHLPHCNELHLYDDSNELMIFQLPTEEACMALFAANVGQSVDISESDAASISERVQAVFDVTLMHNGMTFTPVRLLPKAA